jgi:hypothetical protein
MTSINITALKTRALHPRLGVTALRLFGSAAGWACRSGIRAASDRLDLLPRVVGAAYQRSRLDMSKADLLLAELFQVGELVGRVVSVYR